MEDYYKKFWKALIFDAFKKLGDMYLAEDCAQESLILLFEKIKNGSKFENDSAVATFLYRTNSNNAMHIKRTMARSGLKLEDILPFDIVDSTSVEDTVIREERENALDKALKSIPVHHAYAAVFHYGYNLTYPEVANHMGKTKDCARKYSVRGIKELREKIENQNSAEKTEVKDVRKKI